MLGIQSQELLVKRSEQKGKASPAREVLNVSRKGEVDLGRTRQSGGGPSLGQSSLGARASPSSGRHASAMAEM